MLEEDNGIDSMDIGTHFQEADPQRHARELPLARRISNRHCFDCSFLPRRCRRKTDLMQIAEGLFSMQLRVQSHGVPTACSPAIFEVIDKAIGATSRTAAGTLGEGTGFHEAPHRTAMDAEAVGNDALRNPFPMQGDYLVIQPLAPLPTYILPLRLSR
jgi:hypothetical protein